MGSRIVRSISLTCVYLFLLCLLLLSFENCLAVNRAMISFAGEPEYKLVNEVYKGNELIGWVYEIYVRLKNDGNVRSQELIVSLKDAEGFTLEDRVYIDPGEIKTVNFTWSTLNKNQVLLISYYPSDPNASLDQYNHGSTELNIGGKSDVSSTTTPGFEILVFTLALLAVIFLVKKYSDK